MPEACCCASAVASAPSETDILSRLEGILADSLGKPGGLIPALQTAQAVFGYLPECALRRIVEVMTCPGGCIGGGGQPRFTDDSVRLKRIAAIYAEDEGKQIRKSHENPAVQELYRAFLGKPLGHKSHELLHTTYTPRERR